MRWRFAAVFGAVLAGSAIAQAKLPPDVARFVERRDGCDHFCGEEPYDAERRKFLEQKARELCVGTDRELARLKKKFRDSRAVMAKLNEYEARIEASGPPSCGIEGEVIQWIADYCMLKMQTDDEIAVSGCIAEYHKRAFATECAAKSHYKRAMCGLLATGGGSGQAIEKCVRDPAFMGRTVKEGGVGGAGGEPRKAR